MCLFCENVFVDMLKDVWSVRKDVRVSNAVKASDVGQKSYYSRHGGVAGKFAEIGQKLSVVSLLAIIIKSWSP